MSSQIPSDSIALPDIEVSDLPDLPILYPVRQYAEKPTVAEAQADVEEAGRDGREWEPGEREAVVAALEAELEGELPPKKRKRYENQQIPMFKRWLDDSVR